MRFAGIPPVQETLNEPGGLLKNRPFYVHIATIFIVTVLAILISLGLYTRSQLKAMIAESTQTRLDHVQRELALELQVLRAPTELIVGLTRQFRGLTDARTFDERFERVAVLAEALESQPHITAFYIGYDNGEFFLLRPLLDDAARARFKAPATSRFMVQSVEQAGERTRWVALDGQFKALQELSPPGYQYDPRQQPWYQAAIGTDRMIRTEPHVLAETRTLGRTVALRSANGKAVVGADVDTAALSTTLQQSRLTPSAEMAISDSQGGVLAYSDPTKVATQDPQGKLARATLGGLSPVMAAVNADREAFSSTRIVTLNERYWSIKVAPMVTQVGRDLLVVAVPVDELEAQTIAIGKRLMLITLIVIVLAVPVIFLVARQIARQLNSLTEQAAAIRRFDFKTEVPLETRIKEIFGLGRAMKQMKDTIQKFLEVSIALAAERNFEKLQDRVLREVREAAGADGGVIYLYDEDRNLLRYSAQLWEQGGRDVSAAQPDLALEDASHPVVAAVKRLHEPSIHRVAHPRPQGLEYIDARYGESTVEIIVLPLLGRTGELVGALCASMAPDKPVPTKERMALVEAFAGAAAVSIDQQRLLQVQKNLLNAFIGLVAGAIDAKSPYTGGHCQRVPELTEMLARAAHEAKDGPFADFKLNDDGWEALRIAAWLHDCGKVTTPEYVVDKATKLETIYDRIHEVRMRFEVLKRDAEIAALKAIAAGGDSAAINAKLREEAQSLDDDYRFVASCNEGGEFMSPDKVERLKKIARGTWQRTLDNRLGVSWEERQRMEREPAAALPTAENVLADKAEHVLERGPRDLMPADNPWGFQLTVPAHMYNRGELYNLAIGRGTLSEEERYKINDHIVQTIIMLSQLPFPAHLKSVPELAGGHHEKMDGTGYPKRLRREQMSVPARIMAIADIFEALTATDRPYKKGKKLSEAIKIMGFMIKEQHIDPDLFRLFLRSGVYRRYAEKHLQPEFVDEVDVAPYLKVA